MVHYQFEEIFSEVRRRCEAMSVLQRFAKEQVRVIRTAEAIREIVEPLRDRNDRWIEQADGSSRPGVAIDRQDLLEEVRQTLGRSFNETAFEDALRLCTVNRRDRIQYYDVWRGLQDLVYGYYRQTERAQYIRHYFDLLYQQSIGDLRTALTQADPQFYLYRDPKTGAVRLGQLIDSRSRVDFHYHYRAVYGVEPEYIKLKEGKYLYFDSPDIRD